MMKKVKVALLGIGGYARLYVNYLLDRADPQKVEITAAADPSPNGCLRLAELQAAGCRLYNNAEDLFAAEQVDLTVISTPIHLHAQNTILALQNGSHVLCEKPLCGDLAHIEPMLAARDAAGKFVMLGYQWSHNPGVLKLKQDILEGVYGKLCSCKAIAFMGRDFAYFNRNGWAGRIKTPAGDIINDSIANNAAAHYLHNLLFLSGNTLESAAPAKNISAQLYRANDIETFDTIVSTATCGEDIQLKYIATHVADLQKQMQFDLEFTNGRVTYLGGQTAGEIMGYVSGEATPRVYGNPDLAGYRKLELAIENLGALKPFVPCGIETAACHTRFIDALQSVSVQNFASERLRPREDTPGVVVEGLSQELLALYNT